MKYNVYVDSDNELVVNRVGFTYGKINFRGRNRSKRIKQALDYDLKSNFINQLEYNQCLSFL